MQILIEDGKPVVKLKKGEETSLREARRLCQELAEWLEHEDAAQSADCLDRVIGDFISGGTEESAASAEESAHD